MTNVGYDLDTSGGLMPLIRALIKPPDEDLNIQKPKKPQHPYYKRPGKGHNHDSCDACGEGGDLICCDRCPASFHLGCYDPPLDENDIPAGLWLCRECRAGDEPPPSSRSSRAQSPADKSDTEKKTRSLRNNSTNSNAKKKVKEESKENDGEDAEKEAVIENELSPMEILVKAAKVMNPKQFELPREMKIPCLFPGTEKAEGGSGVVGTDAWGCVPLPARSCYVCRATCKLAPLLQCDYCPLLFHQDCLDPPLTSLPTGRWMCPNHVEQYVDWKLVNSVSATERVALWDKFSGPVDQHAIKVDFLRRARRARPAFRVKVPCGVRGRVVVPRMVRMHYRRPPPLLPSRREHVRCAAVMKTLGEDDSCDESEEEAAPKHQICLNLSCARDGHDAHAARPPQLRPATRRDADDDLKAMTDDISKAERTTESSESSDSDFENLTRVVKKRKVISGKEKRAGRRPEMLTLRQDDDVDELLEAVEQQLQQLDERLVRLLAWQRLRQVARGEQAWGRWAEGGAGAGGWARALRAGGQLARLRLRRALPSELLARADRERIAALVWGAPPAAAPAAPPAPAALPTAPARAVLCELTPPDKSGTSGLGQATPMRLSRLWVGAGGCDVRLDARCARVSRTHACIFRDEVTGHFELINYSEWGSRVNGVLYACDLSERHAPATAPAHAPRARALTAGGDLARACACAPGAPPATAAWEGSALLAHGALLQFGCCAYVFSVTGAPPPAQG